MTFSRAVNEGNRPTPWRVREIPILVRWWVFTCLSRLPSYFTLPESGLTKPVITLKTVVFPAPLGPMRPVTEPSGIPILTSSRICSPPKETLMSTV